MATAELKNLSYEEKYNLATNEGTPTEILAILAKDIDWRVRKAVVSNKNAPEEVLSNLAKTMIPVFVNRLYIIKTFLHILLQYSLTIKTLIFVIMLQAIKKHHLKRLQNLL